MIPIYDPTIADDGRGRTCHAPGHSRTTSFRRTCSIPTVAKALAAFRAGPTPLPNNGAAPGTFNYVTTITSSRTAAEIRPNTKISVKGDHNFSAKSRISGYWGYNRSSAEARAERRRRPARQLS